MDNRSTKHQLQLQEESAGTPPAPQRDPENNIRSSLEIMGCLAPVAGACANMSRPPSRISDFSFVASAARIPEQMEFRPGEGANNKQYIPFIGCLFLVCMSLMSITATGAVITVMKQMGRPVPGGYPVGLTLSLIIFVFSAAGLGYILCGSPPVFSEVPQRAFATLWAIHWPSMRVPYMQWRFARRMFSRPRMPGSSGGQPSSNLPHPQEFELESLENRSRRPPTPYPGSPIPAPPIPTGAAQAATQQLRQTLPLGFPVPPSRRINSAVSRMSTISFRSAPRSVSPLSDAPPTPPPKDPDLSRLQSQEALLPPTASGDALAQSDTSASILTTLCDAVQLPSPEQEPGAATHNYSPLTEVSSPFSGNTSQDPVEIQSPKPTYPIKLASPSRGREHKG